MSGWVHWMEEKKLRQRLYDRMMKNFWKNLSEKDESDRAARVAEYENQKQQDLQQQQQQRKKDNHDEDLRQQQRFFDIYLRSIASSSRQPSS
jgi:hypothetical protein